MDQHKIVHHVEVGGKYYIMGILALLRELALMAPFLSESPSK